jgi:hypothetical protein
LLSQFGERGEEGLFGGIEFSRVGDGLLAEGSEEKVKGGEVHSSVFDCFDQPQEFFEFFLEEVQSHFIQLDVIGCLAVELFGGVDHVVVGFGKHVGWGRFFVGHEVIRRGTNAE